jgi:hypothetical protein
MSAADFLEDYFENDLIKAAMASPGIIGTALGVYSPGSAYILLHHVMGDVDGNIGAWGLARGGMGAISNALAGALQEHGGEIRTEAGVEQIQVENGKAVGVVLHNGDELRAPGSVLESGQIINSNPEAVVLWGNAKETALILKQMRQMGMKQAVYGSDRLVSPEFLKIAGPLAEGVVTTCQYNPTLEIPELIAFNRNYQERFGQEPDVFAAHAYDGMNILIQAIQKAGLNRVLIRDLLTDLKTFQGYRGITGEIIFDASWNDIGPIWMAEVRDGKYEFFPPPPLTSLKTEKDQ